MNVTWDKFIDITKQWLSTCPPDVFDSAKTQAPQFVKAIREAIEKLERKMNAKKVYY